MIQKSAQMGVFWDTWHQPPRPITLISVNLSNDRKWERAWEFLFYDPIAGLIIHHLSQQFYRIVCLIAIFPLHEAESVKLGNVSRRQTTLSIKRGKELMFHGKKKNKQEKILGNLKKQEKKSNRVFECTIVIVNPSWSDGSTPRSSIEDNMPRARSYSDGLSKCISTYS